MTPLQRIRAAQHFHPDKFVPLEICGKRIGWIRRDLVALLRRWPDLLEIGEASVRLSPALADEPARTAALAEVTRTLERDGAITGWRNETYPVRIGREDVPLLHVERAAMRFFGLTSSATHLNGYVRSPDGMHLWVARRSATKSIDPGMLDTLVGGGIPSGQDAWQALLRECYEEAGIERSLAAQAKAVGTLQVCHEVREGLHSEILYAHDLELPQDFAPRNMDGEVSEFMQLQPAIVGERIAWGEFTVEAGVVALDFLARHRGIDVSDEIGTAIDRCRLRP